MGEIDCLVKELGAHVLYVHHANKSGEFLGTTAFKAMCPTYMQIRRIGEQQQRVLSSDQRNGKNFESLPISFDKYGWLKIVGTLEDVWIEEMKPKITELLEIENTGMSEAQIRQSVEGRGIIVSKAVRQLFGENEIQRTGTGRKGDPFKYFLAANLLRDPSDNPSEDCRPNGGVVGLSQGGILKAGKRFSSYLLSLGEENQEGETDKTTGRESKNTTQVNETTSENALPEVLGRAREEHGKSTGRESEKNSLPETPETGKTDFEEI
jgi:hypothetical protein